MVDANRFFGLNNVGDPMRLGLSWLTLADNVDIDSTGKISRRGGFAELVSVTSMTGAYATFDEQRMYYVADGNLTTGDGVVLASGFGSAPMHWCEVNGQVFYNNGTQRGIIMPDNEMLPWDWPMPATPIVAAVTGDLAPGLYRVACTFVLPDGRETGTSDAAEIEIADGQALQVSAIAQLAGGRTRTYIAPANSDVFGLAYQGAGSAFTWNASPDSLGFEQSTGFASPLPLGATVIQHWRGKVYAAQYDPASDTSALWKSRALGWHLFDLDDDFAAIHGQILMLAPHDQALVIGTDTHIYALNADGLVTLAEYGTVPGCAWAVDDSSSAKTVYFWTQRGMCRFPEFANLTVKHVSVAPGVRAGAAVMQDGGQSRFVASLHAGGSAFNQR